MFYQIIIKQRDKWYAENCPIRKSISLLMRISSK